MQPLYRSVKTKIPTLAWLLFCLHIPLTGLAEEAPGESTQSVLAHNSQPAWSRLDRSKLRLRSQHVLVLDGDGNEVYAKAADEQVPIASITKLMTAIVTLDSNLDLHERLTISPADQDLHKRTGSRLAIGARLSRLELLHLALMSSENRAASALARTYPGGLPAFVRAMNLKAGMLGMHDTRFVDGTGLNERNVSTARDLARLVRAAEQYPFIREASTTRSAEVRPWKSRAPLQYRNTNRLIGKEHWPISLSKTGYLNEAGRCLVMSVEIGGRPLVVVLLDSYGKLTPVGDSGRLRTWIEAATSGRRSS